MNCECVNIRFVCNRHANNLSVDPNVTLFQLIHLLKKYTPELNFPIAYSYDGDWTPLSNEHDWHQVLIMYKSFDTSVRCKKDGRMMLSVRKTHKPIAEKREFQPLHVQVETDESMPCRILPPNRQQVVQYESDDEEANDTETEEPPLGKPITFDDFFEQKMQSLVADMPPSFASFNINNHRRLH